MFCSFSVHFRVRASLVWLGRLCSSLSVFSAALVLLFLCSFLVFGGSCSALPLLFSVLFDQGTESGPHVWVHLASEASKQERPGGTSRDQERA